jgi:hypothetical protein
MQYGSLSELSVAVRQLAGAPRILRVAIGLAFLVALIIRVLLAAAATPVFSSDARDYRVLAENLAAGRGYMQVYEGETEAFRGFTFRAFRSPGYPVFLAGLHSVFGWNDYAYLLPNIVADLVTQVCFLLIAGRLFGAGAALFVQVLLALHVLWTLNPMTESLYTALFASLALLLVFGLPLRTWGGALGFGLIAAAALFVRPVTICVFAALAWQVLWRRLRPRSGRAAAFSPRSAAALEAGESLSAGARGAPRAASRGMLREVLLLGLALLPSVASVSAWAMRNDRLFGEPVLFTTNLGHHNAWDFGLHADRAFAHFRAQGLNEAQINRALLRSEWEIALAHPLSWLVTYVERVGQLFSLTPAWEVENLWGAILKPEASWAGRLFRASYAQYYVTYALAGAGALVLGWQRRGLAGLWSLLLFYVVTHALVSRGDIRFIAPMYPIMCVLAGGLYAAAWEHVRGNPPRGRAVRERG